MEIRDLPEIVDFEASGYDRNSGCSYHVDVYLIDVYSDDTSEYSVDFTCRFLDFGELREPPSEMNRIFQLDKMSNAGFPEVIQWLVDAEDVPCEAGGMAVRLFTRDLIFACPKTKSVVAVLAVNFIGWDLSYYHRRVEDDPVVTAALAAAMEALALDSSGRGADRAAVEALENVVISDLETDDTTTSSCCMVCMEEFPVGSEATRMPCSHVFHGDCIVMWLQNRSECPLCRFELPSETD